MMIDRLSGRAVVSPEGLARLDAALAQIDLHPEQWEQRSWAQKQGCKTAYCVAGWLVVQAGAQIGWTPQDEEDEEEDDTTTLCETSGGRIVGIDDYALHLLMEADPEPPEPPELYRTRMTSGSIRELFSGGNDREALQFFRDKYAAELADAQAHGRLEQWRP